MAKTVKELLGAVEIDNPLKDFRIFSPPNYDIKITKGESVSIPAKFIPNLVTEGVVEKEMLNKSKKG